MAVTPELHIKTHTSFIKNKEQDMPDMLFTVTTGKKKCYATIFAHFYMTCALNMKIF